jgi:phosphatidylserine decarboxylase
MVAIGALLVGSVNFTVKSNQSIEKGDELGRIKKKSIFFYINKYFIYLGYFAYGGSTIVIVFKAGMVKWDDDLRHNLNNSMETLVRMGEHIGQRIT